MEEKMRLDVRLVQEGLASSRERAKEWIQAGRVQANGVTLRKAGCLVSVSAQLAVAGDPLPYVSRGGLKLEKALEVFAISLQGKTCLDAGASTGGFTDCMLQKGASKVYAVDVGHGQLAEKLRRDSRVINRENTNVRELGPEIIPEPCDFACADLSFISLTKVLPAISSCLKEKSSLVCLIKPQFEAGRDKIGKKGVVKDPKVHRQVLNQVTEYCEETGLRVHGLTVSPIRGQEGNREFLVYLVKNIEEERSENLPEQIRRVLQEAQRE